MKRLAEDAALLERALREGWTSERDELSELLARRPEWVALVEGPARVPETRGAEAEADRRLVDELLALARADSGARVRRRRSAWVLRGWAIAAAVLIFALGAWWGAQRSAGPRLDDDQSLGAGTGSETEPEVWCVGPLGVASAFGRFEWKAVRELGPDESYSLTVYSVDEDGVILDQVLGTRGIRDEFWTPDPEDLELLPQRILWRVRRVDAGDVQTGFAEASASR